MRFIFYLIVFICFSFSSFAVPAFPGAEGFGKNATGGRGGQIIYVTNLNDSGEGSLRHAVEDVSGPRIVLFQVSGTIDLKNNITVREGNLTIAGQRASGGVTLRNAGISVGASNVIIRGMRIRPGDNPEGKRPENRDAIQIINDGVQDVIIDHCSLSWSIDETLSTWFKIKNITIQWSIISEGLKDSLHPNGFHSTGLLVGDNAENVSVLNNYFAHNNRRNPMLSSIISAEVYNNVMYNWGKYGLQVQDYNGSNNESIANIEGNYFKVGSSVINEKPIMMWKLPVKSKIYIGSNMYEKNNLKINFTNGSSLIWIRETEARPVSNMAFEGSGYEPIDAEEAKNKVLNSAGAIWPKRDDVDKRVIRDFHDSTGEIIDSQDDVGGWPVLDTIYVLKDSDGDGMPNKWETAYGLERYDSADGNMDNDGDGYTNVEEYINYTNPNVADAADNFTAW